MTFLWNILYSDCLSSHALHSLLFAVSIFALPTLFWKVSNLILHLFWRRMWNTGSCCEREFVLREDDGDGFWLVEVLVSLREMGWEGLVYPVSFVPQASGSEINVVHVLLHHLPAKFRGWVRRNGSCRGTGFFSSCLRLRTALCLNSTELLVKTSQNN